MIVTYSSTSRLLFYNSRRIYTFLPFCFRLSNFLFIHQPSVSSEKVFSPRYVLLLQPLQFGRNNGSTTERIIRGSIPGRCNVFFSPSTLPDMVPTQPYIQSVQQFFPGCKTFRPRRRPVTSIYRRRQDEIQTQLRPDLSLLAVETDSFTLPLCMDSKRKEFN